jgi:hypothetical protein
VRVDARPHAVRAVIFGVLFSVPLWLLIVAVVVAVVS